MTTATAARKVARAAAEPGGAPPATPEELRAYIPYLVNRLSNRISADQNRFLADIGLNNAILRTLSVLHIYETLTVNEITVLAVIEQSSASRTVDQMLETGLVTRRSGAQDQRRREVAVLAATEAVARHHDAAAEQTIQRVLLCEFAAAGCREQARNDGGALRIEVGLHGSPVDRRESRIV